MPKDVAYYLTLPWSLEVRLDEDGGWFSHVRELLGCMSQGDTAEEALRNLQEVLPLWLETSLESGYEIPEPRPAEDYSGKFVVRVPRSMHRQLAEAAEHDGVSLNQYVNVALSHTLGARDTLVAPAKPTAYRTPARRSPARLSVQEKGEQYD